MRRLLLPGCALLAALLVSGCALDGPQSTLAPAGPVAEREKEVFMVTLYVALGIFAVVGSLFAYCLVKFRHPGEITENTPLPDQGHGNPVLEIGLILVSILLVGVIAVPTLGGIFYVTTMPANTAGQVNVNVTGLQWWWKFEYPELGVVTGNEVALPQGKVVRFNLKTADVIHSFWIPRLGGKTDVMPNADNWQWLQGDVPGLYYGQCAELCGESHAFMRFRALVLPQTEFDAWVAHQKSPAVAPETPELEAGQKAFLSNRCGICHTIRGTMAGGQIGPDLTHVGSRHSIAAGIMDNTTENLEAWIRDPNTHKPGNLMYRTGYRDMKIQVSDGDVKAIANYLSSLK